MKLRTMYLTLVTGSCLILALTAWTAYAWWGVVGTLVCLIISGMTTLITYLITAIHKERS